MDFTSSCDKTIRPVAIYAPNVGQSEHFRDLEKLLSTTDSLVLLGNFNIICDTHVDNVVSKTDRRSNVGFQDLISRFQLANAYRMKFPNVPL